MTGTEADTQTAATADDQCAARYLANLAALYQRDPELAARVDALPFAEVPTLEPTRDGHVTVRLPGSDGRLVYAHSRYRPLNEAATFVAGQQEAAEADESGSSAFIIAGLGLGYHLLEFDRRLDHPILIVVEESVGLIKAALCTVDLNELLMSGRLVLLTAVDKGHVHDKLARINTDLMLGLRFVALPYAQRRGAAVQPTDPEPGFHDRIQQLVLDYLSHAHMQLMTLLRNARITCKNVSFNLPTYLGRPGVELLQGRGAGYPAIVVAAGPSLARHLDQLGELRERAVIIAVQTVFKLLLARHAAPHFVTSLDFHEVSTEFFRGADNVADTILVAEPKATWHVLDGYPGRTHVLHHPFVDDLLRDAAPSRGALKSGSTVAHLAFYLAEYLGCDPIILLGPDLSFSEGFYYPPGMPIERIWGPELGRFQTIEMKQWERIVRGRPILRTVKDIHGRDVYTDDQLFSYAEQFQSDFLASPARVIHACESGMRLEGTEVMTLQAAAERFCTRKLPEGLFEDSDAHPDASSASETCQRAGQAIEQRLEELGEIKCIAVEMNGLLEQLARLLERPSEFNRLIVRVDDLRSRMHKYERTYKLVTEVSQMAELRRYTADRRIGKQGRETAETAKQRLARDSDFVASFIDGCEWLEGMLPQALHRVRERMS